VGLRETHSIERHGVEKEEPQPDPRSALIWPVGLVGCGFDFFLFAGEVGLVWFFFFFFFFFFFKLIKAQKWLTFPSRF
jgi:hypothetical protein